MRRKGRASGSPHPEDFNDPRISFLYPYDMVFPFRSPFPWHIGHSRRASSSSSPRASGRALLSMKTRAACHFWHSASGLYLRVCQTHSHFLKFHLRMLTTTSLNSNYGRNWNPFWRCGHIFEKAFQHHANGCNL